MFRCDLDCLNCKYPDCILNGKELKLLYKEDSKLIDNYVEMNDGLGENRERFKKYYQKNKEKIKERFKENKDKLKEYYKKYRQENKDKLKEYSKKYYREKKEKLEEQRTKFE